MTRNPSCVRQIRAATLLFSIAGTLAVTDLPGQIPSESLPSFGVTSIRPSAGPGQGPDRFSGFRIRPASRTVEMRDVTLRMLVTYAYAVPGFQIVGWPKWAESDRYDIQAKAAEASAAPPLRRESATPTRMALRVQALLNDRFQLRIHKEVRDLPVYELTPEKSGVKLRSSTDQGSPQPVQSGGAALLAEQGALKPGSLLEQNSPSGWTMRGAAVPISELVSDLAGHLDRPVIDRTGLNPGLYDFKLQWADDLGFHQDSPGAATVPPDREEPSIFKAVEEQLGLHLVPSKGAVEVLVIDSIQKPSSN